MRFGFSVRLSSRILSHAIAPCVLAFLSVGCRSTVNAGPTTSLLPTPTTGEASSTAQGPAQPSAEDTALDGQPEPRVFVGKLVLSEGSALYRVDVTCNQMLSECTGEPRRLTRLPALFVLPTWSPDGDRVLFASDLDPEVSDVLGVFLVGEWGGTPETVASAGHDPGWSPTGEQVVYATWEGGGRLMIAPAGGGARIAVERPFASHPSWSPDGSRIAFLADRLGAASLYVLYIRDQALEPVAGNATGFLQWSPTGTHLAYTVMSGKSAELFIAAVGASPGSIGAPQQVPAEGSISYPAWSPDGRTIAYVSRQNGNEGIHLASVRCESQADPCEMKPRPVIDEPETETTPIWFPDSDHLAYLSGAGSSWRLELIDVESLHSQVILDDLASPRDLDGHIQ